MTKGWNKSDWRNKARVQMPDYPDQTALKAVESQKQYLLKNGFISKDFDLRDWVDPRPLEMARSMATELAGA